ncbi:hypothetical protein [Variovorax sp. 3P27G3]|uniref:hypothetical protein n=1 Tax=Variovorax sp. 3P27G3 TaxID=2502214 RepID=UPI0010F9FC0A|nr:hypothetical protein [Variovorax sp. 3P27G3]
MVDVDLSYSPRQRGETIEESVKHPLRSLCALALLCMHGAHAQNASPATAEVAAFLANSTHCAVLIGSVDHAADGADRVYGEMLAAALMGLGTPLPSAVEWMHSACASRLAQPEPLAKEVL